MSNQARSTHRNLREAVRRSSKAHRLLHAPLNVAKTAWWVLVRLAIALAVLFAVAYWLAWRLDLGDF